uniref:Uncharacterized protein n=1 Tax=Amphimedon queenslandica TaxID=400682 RepID=A0A1X7SQB8_AMPQE
MDNKRKQYFLLLLLATLTGEDDTSPLSCTTSDFSVDSSDTNNVSDNELSMPYSTITESTKEELPIDNTTMQTIHNNLSTTSEH